MLISRNVSVHIFTAWGTFPERIHSAMARAEVGGSQGSSGLDTVEFKLIVTGPVALRKELNCSRKY
jgi:hypothetical protein